MKLLETFAGHIYYGLKLCISPSKESLENTTGFPGSLPDQTLESQPHHNVTMSSELSNIPLLAVECAVLKILAAWILPMEEIIKTEIECCLVCFHVGCTSLCHTKAGISFKLVRCSKFCMAMCSQYGSKYCSRIHIFDGKSLLQVLAHALKSSLGRILSLQWCWQFAPRAAPSLHPDPAAPAGWTAAVLLQAILH